VEVFSLSFDVCLATRMFVFSGPFMNEGVSSDFDDQNLLVVHKCQ